MLRGALLILMLGVSFVTFAPSASANWFNGCPTEVVELAGSVTSPQSPNFDLGECDPTQAGGPSLEQCMCIVPNPICPTSDGDLPGNLDGLLPPIIPLP